MVNPPSEFVVGLLITSGSFGLLAAGTLSDAGLSKKDHKI
jgi:hypothetical protein